MTEPSTFISEEVVERLHALVERGYVLALGTPGAGGIYMTHPGKAPPLVLWGDGQLLDMYPTDIKSDADRTIIEPLDVDAFATFIARIPPPSAIQKVLGATLGDAAGHFVTWVIFLAFIAICGAVADTVFRFLKSLFS